MNAVRDFKSSFNIEVNAKQNQLSWTVIDGQEKNEGVEKMTKECLEEKLYFFYNNGGPKMDI